MVDGWLGRIYRADADDDAYNSAVGVSGFIIQGGSMNTHTHTHTHEDLFKFSLAHTHMHTYLMTPIGRHWKIRIK